jgi:hypothetical protein
LKNGEGVILGMIFVYGTKFKIEKINLEKQVTKQVAIEQSDKSKKKV